MSKRSQLLIDEDIERLKRYLQNGRIFINKLSYKNIQFIHIENDQESSLPAQDITKTVCYALDLPYQYIKSKRLSYCNMKRYSNPNRVIEAGLKRTSLSQFSFFELWNQ